MARDTKTLGSDGLNLSEATQVDGRWTVKGEIPLETRHDNHWLEDWSEWLEAGWDAGKAWSTAEEVATQFAALKPASPLREWMRYLRYDGPKREAAMEAIPYLDKPASEVRATVLQEGRLIVGELRKLRKAPMFCGGLGSWRSRLGRKGRWARWS